MRDFKRLLQQVRNNGHEVEVTNGTHLRVKGTNGKLVILPHSPGRGRAFQNCKATLKRHGLL